MDLRTSRKPPAVPMAIGSPTDAREAAVMAELTAPMLPLELVRKLAWPRLEVFQVVRGLAQSARLDTLRARFDRDAREAMAGGTSGWTWNGLALGGVGQRIVEAQARGLSEAGERGEVGVVDALSALAEPLWVELDPLWRGFLEAERFATRVAFGLPDEPEPGQAERFAGELVALFEVLPSGARGRLEALVEGRASWSAGPRVFGADGSRELTRVVARATLGLLFEEGSESELEEVLGRVGVGSVLAVFVGDHLALTGRGGPRPTPAWISEAV
jgi:hypothetical protein